MAEENIVTVDGLAVAVTSATSNRLTLTMPDHEDGKVKVTLTVNGKQADSDLETVYAPLPELVAKVTGMYPLKGFVGDVVTISGENFSDVVAENEVKFGDNLAEIQSVTKNTIKVIAPENAKGAVDVQVITRGKTFRVPSQFTYMTFVITSNFPQKGASGEKVTISGEGFSPVATENIVVVGDEVATVESATENSLVVIMPDNPEGEYEFSVTVGGKTIKGGKFEYGGTWRMETLITGYSKLQDLALASDGTLWVTRREGAAHSIYKYNPAGNAFSLVKESKSNTPSETDHLANSFPWGIDVGDDGIVYFAAKGTSKVLTCDAQGNILPYETGSAAISSPMKVLVDASDNVYVLCRAAISKIYKIKDGELLATYTLPKAPSAGYEFMCFNADKSRIFAFPNDSGDIQMIDLSDGSMTRVAGIGKNHSSAADYTDGEPGSPLTATLRQTGGAICASDGTLYFTDCIGKTIRTFRPDASGDYSKGTIETILGVPYNSSVLSYPNGIALDADGKTLYSLDNSGKLCKIYYK